MLGAFLFMWAICDERWLYEPYVFQDQDKGTQTPAIYMDREKAKEIAEKMNQQSSLYHYVVRYW